MTPAEPNYFARLTDERVRSYLLLWAGSVAVVCGGLFLRGTPIAAVIPFVFAALGLAFHRTAMPGLFVLSVAYFTLYPEGLPDRARYLPPLSRSAFRIVDLLFVPAVLCYLAAQFRLYSLTHRAVPDDRPGHVKKAALPTVRTNAVGEMELPRLFATIAATVFVAQFVWFLTVNLEPTFDGIPGFRYVSATASPRALAVSRFLILGTLAFVVVPLIGVGLWYLRLARLRTDEARLLMLDTGWRESRRELARIETWRAPRSTGPRSGWRIVLRVIKYVLMMGFIVGAFTFLLLMAMRSLYL